jgi:aryl-alcohol dehydrogenase-like predicted oxidoreductase
MASAAAAGTFDIADMTVNRLGFGAMRITGKGVWGDPPDREAARAVLRRAVELDVNLIDTADSYGPHVSEELITEALYPYPDDLVIATKGGLERSGPGQWHRNGHPDRPVPAARARPQCSDRGLPGRAERAPERGQDPPHRRVELRQRAARAGARALHDRLGAEPL